MKKIITLLLIILFAVSWQLNAQYFTEDFENGGNFPTGWTLIPGTGDDWAIDQGDDYGPGAAQSGTYCAFFNDYDYSSGTTADMISPNIDLSGATAPQLVFWYFDAGGSDVVEVLVSTDGTNYTSVFTTPDTVSSWTEFTIDLSPYAGESTVTIAWRGTSIYGFSNPHVDNIVVAEPPTCPAPNGLSASNITDDSAELSWTENGSATAWNIEYGPAGFTQGSGTVVAVTSNPYTLTGLTPATSYDFYVQADCGGGDVSSWTGPYTFMTPGTCGFFRVDLIDSWGDGWNGGLLTVYINGNVYADFTINNGAGPESHYIPVNTGDILSFVYTAGFYSNENQYIVYDNNGFEVANEGANGTPNNVGDPSVPSGLEACPSCPNPANLSVANVTDTQADLTWFETGSATTWNIEYGTAGFAQGSGTVVAVTSNPYTLTGLTPATSYDFYVQADCGGGDTSDWVGPFTFTTECNPVSTFPYSYGFEDTTVNSEADWTVSCWSANPQNIAGASSYDPPYRWTPIDGPTPSSNTGPAGPHNGSIYAYTEASGSNDGDVAELFSPILDLSGLTQPQLSFYYFMYGADIGTLSVDTYDGTTWTNDVWTISGEQQTSDADPWLEATVSIPNTVTRIKIRAIRGPSYVSDIAVDDILIQETPTCIHPSLLSATNITDNSADLSWTENGTATTWNIEYGPAGFTQGSGTVVAVTSNPYTLTGLTAATSYDFYVQSDCGGGSTSSWEGPFTFRTLCGVVSTFPYNYGFEDVTANTEADWSLSCWSGNPENVSGAGAYDPPYRWTPIDSATPSSDTGPAGPYNGTMYAYTEASGSNGGDVAELISPVFDFSSLSVPQLTFYYYMYGADIGTLSVDTYDGTSWTNDVWTLTGQQQTSDSDPWLEATVFLTNNVTQVRFRAIRGGDYQADIAIDDISIQEAPTCPHPSFLSATNITSDSAELSWTENGSATAWNIEYGPTGFTQGQCTVVAVTSNPYTLTGLSPVTNYDFYVQSDCGGGDLSIWEGPYSFMTSGTCGFFRVDLLDSYGDGWNGGLLTIYVNGTSFMNVTLDNGAGPESYNIPVNQGDILSFDYTPGSYSTENEYVVYDNNNIMLADEGAGAVEPGDIGDPTIPSGFEACPTCPRPTNLTVSNLTAHSADLGWTENGPATAWNIEYGMSGFTPGQGTVVAVTSNPYTLTGLDAAVTYDFYVQSDCGGGDESMWSGPYTFTTLCDTQLPYMQDFDTTMGCWTTEDANGDGKTWMRGTSPTSLSCVSGNGDYVAFVKFNDAYDMNDWLFSPGFDLSAGTTYALEFSYGNDGTTAFAEDMDVYISTGATSADALNGTQILSETGIVDGCHEFANYNITVPTDGIYYFAFHGKSLAGQDILMIDDFKLDLASGINELTNVTAIYPNPTTGQFVIKSHDLKNAQVYVYTLTGKEIYHNTIDSDNYTVNLGHVQKGVYFVKVASENKSYVSKLIIK